MNVINVPTIKKKVFQHIVSPGTNTMRSYPKNVLLGWFQPDSVKMISSIPSEIQINRGNILAINLKIPDNFFDTHRLEISHNGAENLYEDIVVDDKTTKYWIIWETLGNYQDDYIFRFTERNIDNTPSCDIITNEYQIDVNLLATTRSVSLIPDNLETKYFLWSDLKTFSHSIKYELN